MAHRDTKDSKVRFNFEYLRSAIDFLLRDTVWKAIDWRSDCTWGSPRLFAIVSLLWAWSDEKLVKDCFSTARRITLAMYPQKQKVAGSFQAFLKLLKRWNSKLAEELKSALHKRMLDEFADQMKVGKFNIMAVDGSRIGLPRTESNEVSSRPSGIKAKVKARVRVRARVREKEKEKQSSIVTNRRRRKPIR